MIEDNLYVYVQSNVRFDQIFLDCDVKKSGKKSNLLKMSGAFILHNNRSEKFLKNWSKVKNIFQ